MSDDGPSRPDVQTPTRTRYAVLTAYAVFVLLGVEAGVTGVLLLAQIRDYGVDQATIGLTFFTGSAGFLLSGMSTGTVLHRWGTRATLLAGGGLFAVASLAVATRPAFVVFVLLQVLTGYSTGLMGSVLNVFLAALPRAATRLNRLHAFFGVGALLGPLLATWLLTVTTWPTVSLVLAVASLLPLAGVALTYPGRIIAGPSVDTTRGVRPTTVLRRRGVLLAAILLTVYVGLEWGIGNWGFSYLVGARTVPELVAGYTVSGYWLGLTVGRFVISPATSRLGFTVVGQLYLCVLGVTAAAALVWLVPVAGVATIGFVLLGFFLGPIFPTIMAVTPRLAPPRLVPTAIGVINSGSVIGGSLLPWFAGVAAQSIGAWTLLPWTLLLAVVLLALWWRTAAHLDHGDHLGPPSETAVHDVQPHRPVRGMVESFGHGGQDREPERQVQVDG